MQEGMVNKENGRYVIKIIDFWNSNNNINCIGLKIKIIWRLRIQIKYMTI